jgi:hypothetical protein
MNRSKRHLWLGTLATLAALILPPAALATDGVIEINQAAALAGGVTSGDAPGFPVTLSVGASYRLTSDLVVGDGDLTVIEGVLPTGIFSSNGTITLDLNGFAIRCHNNFIIIGGSSCGAGAGIGVDFQEIDGATVKNGTVRNMATHGVLLGDSGTVENLRALDNNSNETGNLAGVYCGSACTIIGSVASGNGRYGFFTGQGSSILDSRVAKNGQSGMRVGSHSLVVRNNVFDNDYQGIVDSGNSTILQNTIGSNGSYGIDSLVGARFAYGNNTLVNNNAGGAQVDGFGTQIDTNFCQTNTVCP